MVYEVWGRYSREQFRDEFLEVYETREEAEEFVYEFNSVWGRSSYIEECESWRCVGMSDTH